MRNSLVRVWADIASASKCRWCKRAIVWRTRFNDGGSVPFNANGTSYGVEVDENGRRVETLCWNDRHDCAERPKALKHRRRETSWTPLSRVVR